MWSSEEIREAYLSFFEKKGHKRLPSFPLVPLNDPSLLLIGAGMAPFKPEFAGKARPVSPRVTTCQKCVRADDIAYVGKTARHHTFFEMLGNFSFGNYFKEETIAWAWELVTRVYRLPEEQLWVSIHPEDDEAFRIWTGRVGVREERVIRIQDNFWGPIGTSGPCGPCSEILYDLGSERSCGKPSCAPGCDCDRYLEFWNLVFTTYEKREDGKLYPLRNKNIDTGLGLERLTMILQNSLSPYETDLFSRLMAAIPDRTDTRWMRRIVADHVRASVFLAADGVTPSNEGRGYVLRKILRRGASFLRLLGERGGGSSESLPRVSFSSLVDPVVQTMGRIYPELVERSSLVTGILRAEEEGFERTLSEGFSLLDQVMEKGKTHNVRVLAGDFVFRLHDTFGFPVELTRELAEAEGFVIDEKGFQEEMEAQRKRGQTSWEARGDRKRSMEPVVSNLPPTEFLGHKKEQARARILCLIRDGKVVDSAEAGEKVVLVLDESPFYPEGGGPVGDAGVISSGGRGESASSAGKLAERRFIIHVDDTQKTEGGVILHYGEVTEGTVLKGERVWAQVSPELRKGIMRHHTATHLLHAALKEVLGPHVAQTGSLVAPERLRFDFSHPQPLAPEEVRKIASLVNQKIMEDLPVSTALTTLDEARSRGVVALFDEKYGEKVRAVVVGEFSKELCGGIHVRRTGEIGSFVVTECSSVGLGTRRIEAKVGEAALEEIRARSSREEELASFLKTPPELLLATVKKLLEERKHVERERGQLRKELARREALAMLQEPEEFHGFQLVAREVSFSSEEIRSMIDLLKEKWPKGIIVLGSREEGKVTIACGAGKEAVKDGAHAGEIVKELARLVEGGGGGRPDFAQAGGKAPEKLPSALAGSTVKEVIERLLSARKST